MLEEQKKASTLLPAVNSCDTVPLFHSTGIRVEAAAAQTAPGAEEGESWLVMISM